MRDRGAGGTRRPSRPAPSGVGGRGNAVRGGNGNSDVNDITGSNANGGQSTSSGQNATPSRSPGIDRNGNPRFPFKPHNPSDFPFIFNRGGSGNRSADSNTNWINNGYVGYSNESKQAAETAYRTQTINPSIRRWVQSNLPALRRAADTKFKKDTGAWKWIVENTPPGTAALDWITSLPNWSGSAPPDVSGPGGPGGGGSRGGGGGSGGSGGGGGGTGTSYQSQINITDPFTARNLINQTLSASLGRMATDKEISDFTLALNAAERLNPQTGMSTASVDAFGNPVTSTITAGGLDRNQVVLDQINKTPEYQAFNTDNVFRQAMSVLASRGA